MEESDINKNWKNLKKAIDSHLGPQRIPRSTVARNPQYSQLTPEPQYAPAVSKEPKVNPKSNGPSSRSAILPNQNTVNTPDSLSTDTSIDGSSSMSHYFTGNEDITILEETAATVTPGTLRLQSTVETDAPQPMTSTTAATVQQSVTSPQNHSFTPSLSQSTSDSSIGLMSPELGSLNVASFLPVGEAPESLYPSNQIDNSVTLQDKPDSAVNQSPEGPKTCPEDGERPSFFFRAIHFSLHAIFQPDKVYAPP
eukprot:XP_011416068.1 PREDICTED: uncharacterized protein LOC105320012 isoform X1 [Crassostrea gigas]